MASNYYTSFGGTDITAVFGDNVFGELQAVQYNVEREKAPIYTMGAVDPRSIARGKRLVTGACVFQVFDRDALIEAMSDDCVWISNDELSTYRTGENFYSNQGALDLGGSVRTLSGTNVDGLDGTGVAAKFKTSTKPLLSDQILPFDITLLGVSEYGRSIQMKILGVELMSENGGVSIDDMSLEKQIQFIARRVTNWEPVDMPPSVCEKANPTPIV